jgi:hypothetical protein
MTSSVVIVIAVHSAGYVLDRVLHGNILYPFGEISIVQPGGKSQHGLPSQSDM